MDVDVARHGTRVAVAVIHADVHREMRPAVAVVTGPIARTALGVTGHVAGAPALQRIEHERDLDAVGLALSADEPADDAGRREAGTARAEAENRSTGSGTFEADIEGDRALAETIFDAVSIIA